MNIHLLAQDIFLFFFFLKERKCKNFVSWLKILTLTMGSRSPICSQHLRLSQGYIWASLVKICLCRVNDNIFFSDVRKSYLLITVHVTGADIKFYDGPRI